MALPVANLGYMPNLGSPGRGPTTVIDDPWQQLAMQVLGQVVSKGVNNAFEQDYTKQAQNEGLAIDPTAEATKWYKKPFTGARTDEGQLGKLRGEHEATGRSNATLAQSGKEAKLGRQTQVAEGQANRQNQLDLQGKAQIFQGAEGAATRANQFAINESDNTAAKVRLDQTVAAQERELGRKLTSEENQSVINAFITQAGKMTAAAPQEALRAGMLGQPAPDPNAQIDALAQKLQSMGYKIVPMQR